MTRSATRRAAALLLLAVLLVVALGPLVALARPEPACRPTPGEWLLAGSVPSGVVWAIDVSGYQHPAAVPYDVLAAAGLCAVIVRAGTGLSPDPSAGDHLARARAAGVPRTGTYWVPRPDLDADAQAAAYVAQLARLRPTMAPVADLEGRWPATGTAALAEAFAAGVDRRARRSGIRTWLYTYPSFHRQHRLGILRRPLWLAEYRTRTRDPTARRPPGDWPGLVLWQYGGGPLPGAPARLGEVDKNVYL